MRGTMKKARAVAALLGMGGQTALAQESDWTFQGTFYLFGSDTTTEIGPIDVDLSFSDALDNLDFAFMGAISASNGTWSFILDAMYTDLTFDGPAPGSGLVFTGTETSVTTTILSAYAAYRVYDTGTTQVDLGGGFRYYDTDTEIRLLGGPPATRSAADDWIDPLLMVRAQTRLADRWIGALAADYGGIESNRETSQITIDVGYELTDRWTLRGGYRYIDIQNELSGQDYRFTQSGPVFGASYRF